MLIIFKFVQYYKCLRTAVRFRIVIQKTDASVQHSSCAVWCAVIHIAGRNTSTRITCMDNSSAANAERHMIHTSATCIENQITGFRIGCADFLSYPLLLSGSTRQADSEFFEY